MLCRLTLNEIAEVDEQIRWSVEGGLFKSWVKTHPRERPAWFPGRFIRSQNVRLYSALSQYNYKCNLP